MDKAFIIMTRIPVPGKTKTRLMDTFSGDQCAEIHKRFLLDIFNLCDRLKDKMHIYVTYTPEGDFEVIKSMIPKYISSFPQIGDDLGCRMKNAIGELFNKGYKKVVLIGTDIPEIQPVYIEDAFNSLNENDLCFGPTMDGGYYLVGMNKCYGNIFSNNISWGNKSVLEGTIDIANKDGLQVALVQKCNDIDTKEDIIKFIKKVNDKNKKWKVFPENTVNFIEDYWSDNDVKRTAKA